MLSSKADLARYPFTPEAVEYVNSLGVEINDFTSQDYLPVIDRAERRVEEALIDGVVGWSSPLNYDVEILSFPLAMVLVASINDPFLKRRYALAESKRAYNLLRNEVRDERLVRIAEKAFNWKIQPTSFVAGQVYDFTLRLDDYLKNAVAFHDSSWKLVNRLVSHGEVYLKRDETARLLSEEVSRHVYRRLEAAERVTLPPLLAYREERLRQLNAKRREKIRGDELPTTAVTAAYPPCIRHAHDSVMAGQNIPHIGRFALTSFLLRIGVDPETVMKMFSDATDFDEKKTRYQVEHIAGLRGGGTRYTPPNCNTLKTHGICLGEDEICKRIRHPLSYYKVKLRQIRTQQ
jgi:DNA primase large subunit